MYINPSMVHIYKDEYLLKALENPRLPKSLKIKIMLELEKRKSPANHHLTRRYESYFRPTQRVLLTSDSEATLCVGVAEAYFTLAEECFEY